jgi:hypothetical protein
MNLNDEQVKRAQEIDRHYRSLKQKEREDLIATAQRSTKISGISENDPHLYKEDLIYTILENTYGRDRIRLWGEWLAEEKKRKKSERRKEKRAAKKV